MATETLRPNADSSVYKTFPDPDPAVYSHYDRVNDQSDLTRIATLEDVTARIDLFPIPGTSIDTTAGDVINSVTVYVRRKRVYTSNPCTPACKCAVYTHSTYYESGDKGAGDSYADTSETWTNNPNTGSPWTTAEINALEIGVKGISCRVFAMFIWWYTTIMVSEVWVVIDYTPAVAKKPVGDGLTFAI